MVHIEHMTATQQIEEQIAETNAKRIAWNGNNEGALNGFSPFESKLEELVAQLEKNTTAAIKVKLSGESLKAERAAFNAQKFTAATLTKANDWCLGRGYSLDDLQSAVKNNQ